MIRRAGFTLFEMILAIMLITALVFTLLPAAERVLSSSAASADRVDRLAQLAIMGDLLDRSLWTGMAMGADGSPGVHGTAEGILITTTGVALRSPKRTDPDDVQRIELEFDADQHEIRIRENNGPPSVLMRGVQWVTYSYHDGQKWGETHSGERGLPHAVAVSVWLDDEGASAEAGDEDGPALDGPALDGQDRGDPDWRRVFAVLDPDAGEPEPTP